MSLLKFILIVSSVIFVFFAIDAYKRRKMNVLHFLVFFGGASTILIFSFNIKLLNQFGNFFGVARGADLLVYIGIIFLSYMFFQLLHKTTRIKKQNTSIIRHQSIQESKGSIDSNTEKVFVVPFYNEGEKVLEIASQIIEKWYGLVVVDDGSRKVDNFQKIQQKFDNNIVTIRHFINLGQWAALQTGFDYLSNLDNHNIKYVVTFDSDWQHRLQDLDKFEKAFDQKTKLDVVLGSRFLGEAKNIPTPRLIVLKMAVLFTRIFHGIKVTDTHNGYRMIDYNVLEKIDLTMNRMEHASEILEIIEQKNMNYQEVPVTIEYSEYSLSKWQKIINMFKIVINLVYKKFFYRD